MGKGVRWRAPLNAMRSFYDDFPNEIAFNSGASNGERYPRPQHKRKKSDNDGEDRLTTSAKKRKVDGVNGSSSEKQEEPVGPGDSANGDKTVLPVRLEPLPVLQEGVSANDQIKQLIQRIQ